MNPLRLRRRWVWVVMVLVATVGIRYVQRRGWVAAMVTPGVVESRVVARALVVAQNGVAEIHPRATGRIRRVLVREGDAVREGQLLAEMETEVLDAEVTRREAEQAATFAQMQRTAAWATEQQALAAEVRAAEQVHNLAQKSLERARVLHNSSAESDEAMDVAQNNVDVTQAKLEAAHMRLRLVHTSHGYEVAAAKGHAVSARAYVEGIRRERAHAQIRAPIAGMILTRRVDPGDILTPNTQMGAPPLFEIADQTKTEVRLEVEEADAAYLALGLECVLTLPGSRSKVGCGTITRLSPKMERRTIGADDARLRADSWVRAAWCTWSKDRDLPIGKRLEVVVKIAAREISTRVPRAAVTIRDGQAWLTLPGFLWDREVPISLGAVDDVYAEVNGIKSATKILMRQ